RSLRSLAFFFDPPAPADPYTLSRPDALPDLTLRKMSASHCGLLHGKEHQFGNAGIGCRPTPVGEDSSDPRSNMHEDSGMNSVIPRLTAAQLPQLNIDSSGGCRSAAAAPLPDESVPLFAVLASPTVPKAPDTAHDMAGHQAPTISPVAAVSR